MKCPHCLVEFHADPSRIQLGSDVDGLWEVEWTLCPNKECRRFTIFLVGSSPAEVGVRHILRVERIMARPRGVVRTPPVIEVPKAYSDDYREACLVLADSPKASAALSRRCLQRVLRDVEKVKPADLADEIQEAIDRGKLPSHLADAIDAVRNIGNFAAHPIKSRSGGEIVDVEPGEAEWNLDTLESLFDFYFVLPSRIKEKRDALDKKLKDVGKPPIKSSSVVSKTS